jgi:lactate permease
VGHGRRAPLSAAASSAIIKDTMILFLSTACVIVPGWPSSSWSNAAARRSVGAWVRELG